VEATKESSLILMNAIPRDLDFEKIRQFETIQCGNSGMLCEISG